MRIRSASVCLWVAMMAFGGLVVGCDRSSSEKKPAAPPPNLAEIPKGEPKKSSPPKPGDAPDAAGSAKPPAPPKAAAEPKPVSAPPPGTATGQPADVPKAVATPAATATVAGSSLTLVGITMTIPDGWVHEPTPTGPMAAAAVFRLAKAEGDADDGTVRVTHFPNMRGMDDMNIQRWLGQVTKADGKPATVDDAKLATTELGAIKLKTLDLSGNVKATMCAEPMPNARMIATIVDHPQGPHFIVATGGAATLKKWEASVDAFLKSAK